MPYTIKKVPGGFKLCLTNDPSKCFSNKPITKAKAILQMKAIGLNEHRPKNKKK